MFKRIISSISPAGVFAGIAIGAIGSLTPILVNALKGHDERRRFSHVLQFDVPILLERSGHGVITNVEFICETREAGTRNDLLIRGGIYAVEGTSLNDLRLALFHSNRYRNGRGDSIDWFGWWMSSVSEEIAVENVNRPIIIVHIWKSRPSTNIADAMDRL